MKAPTTGKVLLPIAWPIILSGQLEKLARICMNTRFRASAKCHAVWVKCFKLPLVSCIEVQPEQIVSAIVCQLMAFVGANKKPCPSPGHPLD